MSLIASLLPCEKRRMDETENQGAAPPVQPLTPAAKRALAEAAERRAAQEARLEDLTRKREVNGRGGLDPVRYEDWEVKGIASDFS
jgi:hypothetical protein